MKSKLTQAIDIRDAALRWIERENLKNGEPEGDAEYEFRIITIGPSVYTTRVQVELPVSVEGSNPEQMNRRVRLSRSASGEGPFKEMMQLEWNAADTKADLQSYYPGWENALDGWGRRT